jgi:hypothetical protein
MENDSREPTVAFSRVAIPACSQTPGPDRLRPTGVIWLVTPSR